MFKMFIRIIKDIYYSITLRVLEYRVLKQLDKEKKGKNNKWDFIQQKYENVIMVDFKRKNEETEEDYPDIKY